MALRTRFFVRKQSFWQTLRYQFPGRFLEEVLLVTVPRGGTPGVN